MVVAEADVAALPEALLPDPLPLDALLLDVALLDVELPVEDDEVDVVELAPDEEEALVVPEELPLAEVVLDELPGPVASLKSRMKVSIRVVHPKDVSGPSVPPQ